MRMRARLPSRTSSGVVAGAETPLNVSQLNSMFAVFGTELFGRMAQPCRMIPKS
jgi:hypothetical protein